MTPCPRCIIITIITHLTSTASVLATGYCRGNAEREYRVQGGTVKKGGAGREGGCVIKGGCQSRNPDLISSHLNFLLLRKLIKLPSPYYAGHVSYYVSGLYLISFRGGLFLATGLWPRCTAHRPCTLYVLSTLYSVLQPEGCTPSLQPGCSWLRVPSGFFLSNALFKL